MPRTKSTQRRATVSFINSQDGKPDKSKIRAHAAYWSHTTRKKGVDDAANRSPLDQLPANADRDLQQQSGMNSRSEAGPSREHIVLPYDFQLGNKFDVFQILPSLPIEMSHPQMLAFQKMFMFKVFGENFIYNDVLTRTNARYTVFAACLLFSTAYYVAKSGNAQESHFMLLKGEVLRNVQTEIYASSGMLSLEVAHAVALLGSPIVSLISDQSSSSSQAKIDLGYVGVTNTRNVRYVEQLAHEDTVVHQRAAKTVLDQWQSVDEPHLRRLKRQLQVYKTMAHAMHILTVESPSIDDLGRSSGEKVTSDVPNTANSLEDWFSPLTQNIILTNSSRSGTDIFEKYTIGLVAVAHGWLATFASLDSENKSLNSDVIKKRKKAAETLSNLPVFDDDGTTTATPIYQASRLTIQVMIRAAEKGISLRAASYEMNYAPRAIKLVRKTIVGQLWRRNTGLLYWIASVLHMAPTADCLRLTSTMLLTHFTQAFATSEIIGAFGIDFALDPLRALIAFDQICRSGSRPGS